MAQFEVKYFNKDKWEDISEHNVLDAIQESFVKVTPIINEMFKGKILLSTRGIYRMKKEIKT